MSISCREGTPASSSDATPDGLRPTRNPDDCPDATFHQNLDALRATAAPLAERLKSADLPSDVRPIEARDGTATNTVGGAFLTALRDLEEIDEEIVAELEKLQGVDGGDLEWRGTWTVLGDSLDIRFDFVTISLFGRIPVLGKVSVPVYRQELDEAEIVELGFRCSLSESELTLQGRSLTAGVTPDLGAVDQEHTEALGSVGKEAVRLAGDRLLSLLRDSDLDEFGFTRD